MQSIAVCHTLEFYNTGPSSPGGEAFVQIFKCHDGMIYENAKIAYILLLTWVLQQDINQ